MWTARRILKELADTDHRRAILTAFFKYADPTHRAVVQAHVAKAMKFREETVRRMPPEKKAEMFARAIGMPELDQFFEMALMQYHTREKAPMMGAFLDKWGVPHDNGSIEADEYKVPNADDVRDAVKSFEGTYDRTDVRLYLATAGLLMAEEWRESTWPVVDEMNAS